MLLRVAAFAAIGGFLYGYDLGLIGGALLNIKDEFHTSEAMDEVIVGAAKIGAFFGTFLGGALMLFYGRRIAITLDSLFYALGPLIMALSPNVMGLVVGRLMVGVGIGISAVVVPTYLAELAPAKLRGRMVELYEVMLGLGMLAALLGDWALQPLPDNWRYMVGLPTLPALIMAAALFILPESPRWLVVNSRLDEALAIIHRIYTKQELPSGMQNSTAEVEHELMQLWSSVEKDKAAVQDRAARRMARRPPLHRPPNATKGTWKQGQRHDRHQRLSQDPDSASGFVDSQAPRHSSAGAGRALPTIPSGHDVEMATVPLNAPEGADEGPLLSQEQGKSDAGAAAQGSSSSTPAPGGPAQAAGTELGAPASTAAAAEEEEEEDLEPPERTDSGKLNPASPLYKSLSQVPDGLRPIRTKSAENEEALREAAARAEADLASQYGVAKPGGRAAHHAGPHMKNSAATGGEAVGFWATFWAMLADIWAVFQGSERKALVMTLWLAFFDQGMASTAIINYAPQILTSAGVESHGAATLYSSAITAAKLAGIFASVALVDRAGRRPLLIVGSFMSAGGMVLLAMADAYHTAALALLSMCIFLLGFSVSYAGVFWVIVSEVFSMTSKSPATAAATAMLFLVGAIANLVFLTLHTWLGYGSFLVFAAIAFAGGIYCAIVVPETKGRTLAEVQALLAGDKGPAPDASAAGMGPMGLHSTSLPIAAVPGGHGAMRHALDGSGSLPQQLHPVPTSSQGAILLSSYADSAPGVDLPEGLGQNRPGLLDRARAVFRRL